MSILPLAILLSGACESADLPRQKGAEKSEAFVADEIEFARGLALELGFVDLATERLDALKKAGRLSERNRERVALTNCEILKLGAEREPDRARRFDLQTRAVQAYAAFLAEYAGSALAREGRMKLAEIAAFRGQFLAEEAQALAEGTGLATEKIGATLDAVLEENPSFKPSDPRIENKVAGAAAVTFTAAIKAANQILDELGAKAAQDRDAKENELYFRAWYAKGKAYYDWGLAFATGTFEREDRLERALSELQDFVITVGETSGWGIKGYLTIARAHGALAAGGPFANAPDEKKRREHASDGISLCDWVVENALPSDPQDLRDVKEAEGEEGIDLRRDLVEEGFAIVLEVANREGDVEGAAKRAKALAEWQKAQGRTPSRPYGYLALLEAARAALAEGSPNDALKLAQRVSKENPRTTLALRAQVLIGEVVKQAVKVDPGVFFEVAQGEYVQKRYAEAIAGCKRALGGLADDADRQKYGGQICLMIGRSFDALDRPYESAEAYRRGALEFSEDDETAPANADGFYKAVAAIRRNPAAREDEAVKALLAEADGAVTSLSSGPRVGKIHWLKADKLDREGDSSKAREELEKIEKGNEWWERAWVRKGVLHFRKDPPDPEGALRAFEAYRAFVADPVNVLGDRAKETRRREALAEADFFTGRIAYARADAEKDPAARRAAFGKVVELFEPFFERWPERLEYHARVYFFLVVAHLETGDVGVAKRTFLQMREKFPEERVTGGAAVKVFEVLDGQVTKAREALKAAAAAALGTKDPAAVSAAQEALAKALAEAAEYLSLYNATAKPIFNNWRKESTLWVELAKSGRADWAKPAGILEAILQKFADDPDMQAQVHHVRRDLAQCYLAQRRLAQAEPLLRETLEKAKTKETQILLAQCLGGYLDTTKQPYEEVAGTGAEAPGGNPAGGVEKYPKFEEANRLWSEVIQSSAEKWNCEGYELFFGRLYMFHRWGKVEPAKTSQARSGLGALEAQDSTLGASACGSEEIAKKYRWLRDRVK